MRKVDPPINRRVSKKVNFLPAISPKRPNTIAPNGRTTKPTAKSASVERKAAVGFSSGKNLVARIVARLPKRSEERRVGKESVSTGRSRWVPYHEKKKNINKI